MGAITLLQILLVEDNNNKAKRIKDLLMTIEGIFEENIIIAPDQVIAKRYMQANKFSIVLLDIQIPVRFEEPAQPDGGIKFLEEINSGKRINSPDYIIGITAFDESYSAANPFFDDRLLALVRYDESSDDWSRKLYNHITHISKKTYGDQMADLKYNYDLGIVCALSDVELDSIKRLSTSWETIYGNDGHPYYIGVFQNEKKKVSVVAAAAPQMGMVATSVLTTNMIQQFTPYYIAMSGIAAGIQGKVNLGDILVADPSWDYGHGKIIDEEGVYKFLPDIQQIRLDRDLRAKFEALRGDTRIFEKIKRDWPGDKPSSSLEMKIGPVASGAAVLANSTVSEAIKGQGRNIIGIEMEVYGFFYAAENSLKPRPKAFAIKSVCDFANKEKGDNIQKYAAFTSSSILYEFVMNHLDFDSKPSLVNAKSTLRV
jgi:nucleoside phosphorylase/CheY-like chemotaxis protein